MLWTSRNNQQTCGSCEAYSGKVTIFKIRDYQIKTPDANLYLGIIAYHLRGVASVGRVYVLYPCDTGVMLYKDRIPVFQRKDIPKDLVIGLGKIVEGSLVDKGRYMFADIVNLEATLPEDYHTLERYKNIGVPRRIYQGTYGNSTFLQEVYYDKSAIRAYSSDGSLLMQEYRQVRDKYDNLYYVRLNENVGIWKDITTDFYVKLVGDITKRTTSVDIENPSLIRALTKLGRDRIRRLGNGFVAIDGRFETLLVWEDTEELAMSWLGVPLAKALLWVDDPEIKATLSTKEEIILEIPKFKETVS